MKKILSLVGARPQFIKEAVINEAMGSQADLTHVLVHSGQHYDSNMSDSFFQELHIPNPDYFLGVGSASHALQTADTMCKFENVLIKEKPDMVLLYGDTNTTLAGALDAAKLHIPIAHVEAGPRTYNKLFPEEVNRVLTDHISDLLFACTDLNVDNLNKEGLYRNVFNTGDVMYDLYMKMTNLFNPLAVIKKYGVSEGRYVVATVHRDFNTDNPEILKNILDLMNITKSEFSLDVVFPMHPRVKKCIHDFGFERLLDNIIVTDPIGYMDLMSLTQFCRFTVTDSGGFQKESYWAGKRALLLMPQGWQEITDTGWHKLVPSIQNANYADLLCDISTTADCPENIFGDGSAATKIVDIIRKYLA